MQILAVSTSCFVATAAAVQDGECVLELAADTGKRHAETVLPLIDRVLSQCGKALSDMDLLAVDVGPGSFTGVRIGVSVVNALAYAAGKPVVSVNALQTIAETAAAEREPVCAVLDARNGNGYAALYRQGQTIKPPEAVVLTEYLSTLPIGTVLLGDIAVPGCVQASPAARLVGQAACRLRISPDKAAMPLYLRPSQAERMWKLRKEANHRDL